MMKIIALSASAPDTRLTPPQDESDKQAHWIDFENLVRETPVEYPRTYRHFLQTGVAPRLPQAVSLETTAACQLACRMCDRSHLRRETMLMSDEVFKAAVAAIAPHRIKINFNGIGEPLLDKKLVDRIAYVRNQGIAEAGLTSNGMLLESRLARELILAGTTRINVSLDGSDQATLDSGHQGADYETVAENVENLLQQKQELGAEGLDVVLRVTVQQGNLAALPDIYRRWHRRVSGIQLNLVYQYGNVDTDPLLPFRWQERIPCPQMLGTMLVLSNGDSTICCLGDVNADLAIGNLARDSLEQCYDGPRAREIRSLHRAGTIESLPVCQRCAASTMSNFQSGAVARALESRCIQLVEQETKTAP